MKTYYLYILASSRNGTLYVGVTNDLRRRMDEHRQAVKDSFTKKYRINRLVYFQQTESIEAAITREKQIKGGSRKNKLILIERDNPTWSDLYDSLFRQ